MVMFTLISYRGLVATLLLEASPAEARSNPFFLGACAELRKLNDQWEKQMTQSHGERVPLEVNIKAWSLTACRSKLLQLTLWAVACRAPLSMGFSRQE